MNKKVLVIIGAVLVFGLAAVCILGVGMGGLFWFWLTPATVESGPVAVDDAGPTPIPRQAEPPPVDFSPRPVLQADIRQPDALAGEPVLVSVRLRNAGALAAAHSGDGGTSPQPLPLHGNWRDFVELTVARVGAGGQTEPVAMNADLLSPGPPETEGEVGVRALAAVWALSPENTAQLEPGDYRAQVRLKAADLLTGEFADIETQADFSLAAPGGAADTARLAQNVAFYYLKQNNCAATLEHALKAIELNPAGLPAYWYAAECYAATGQTAEAVAMLESLLAAMPPEQAGGDYHAAVEIRLARLQGGE